VVGESPSQQQQQRDPPASKIFPFLKGGNRKRAGTRDSSDAIHEECVTPPKNIKIFSTTPPSTDSGKTMIPDSPLKADESLMGYPVKFFRSIRENLQKRTSFISHRKPSSSMSSDHDDIEVVNQERPEPSISPSKKKMVIKKDPEETQFEIAFRISRYLADNFSGSEEPHALFVGEKEPPITFLRYVERLIKLTNKWVEEYDGPDSLGVRCAILAIDYLERLDVQLTSKSIHRYFTTAFLIAIKLLYDYFISNSFWAEVSGCPRKQVNLMEVHLCKALNWDFAVQADKHSDSVKRFMRC
jgi:hypothetical protein